MSNEKRSPGKKGAAAVNAPETAGREMSRGILKSRSEIAAAARKKRLSRLDSSAPEIIIDSAAEAEHAAAPRPPEKRSHGKWWQRIGKRKAAAQKPELPSEETGEMFKRVETALDTAKKRIETGINTETDAQPAENQVRPPEPPTDRYGRIKEDKWQRDDNRFNEVSRAVHARARGTWRAIKFSMSTRISWNYARILWETLIIALVLLATVYIMAIAPRLDAISDSVSAQLRSVSAHTAGGLASLAGESQPEKTYAPTPVSSLPPDENLLVPQTDARPNVELFKLDISQLDTTYVRVTDIDSNVLYDDSPFDMTGSSLLSYYDGTFYCVDSYVLGLDGRIYQVYVGVSMAYWTRLMLIMLLCVAAIDLMRGLYFIWQGKRINAQMLGPIVEMSETARHLNAQNMSERINVEGTRSELRELALVINEMLDRIESAYDGQKQFVSDASHELRTPISVIQGYASMLERWGKDDAEVRDEAITAISKEATNMKELVEKLLFLARNDKKTLKLKPELFDICGMVEDSIRETRMIVTDREIERGDMQPARVLGDRQSLKQALRIFIDNACKYTPEGGTITVSCEQGGMGVLISVADTGCGIPAGDLKKVFDRFYRVDDSRGSVPGHGLGLSIARIIAINHGGKIHVRSKEGVGSVFTLELPGIK